MNLLNKLRNSQYSPSTLNGLVGFSIANLVFFSSWASLLRVSPGFADALTRYLSPLPYSSSYLAVMLDVVIAASIFWSILNFAHSRGPRFYALINVYCLFLFAFPINGLRYEVMAAHGRHIPAIFHQTLWILAALAALGLGVLIISTWAAIRFPESITSFSRRVFLSLLPFAVLACSQGLYALTLIHPLKTRLEGKNHVKFSGTRIVWLLFDEMDESVSFVHRPDFLQLPEFDRLRSSALFGTNAFAPTSRTMLSLPTYLVGKRVVDAKPLNEADNELKFFDGTKAKWSELPGVFGAAHSMGTKTAVVGSYHPYCRILSNELDFCNRQRIRYDFEDDLPSSMYRTVRALFPVHLVNDYTYSYDRMFSDIISAATDPSYGLVFGHLPLPHSPWIYDVSTDKYAGNIMDRVKGYYGNLRLADKALGEIRAAMEKAGTWDDSIVITVSDHWWRYYQKHQPNPDERIPFMVKLPHQQVAYEYSKPLKAEMLHDMVVYLLKTKNITAPELAHWMEGYSSPTSITASR
jgi:hypothetical protein